MSAPDESFPYPVPGAVSGSGKRAVVVDRQTDLRRFEFEHGARPMLALTGDEGSKFFAATWYLQGHLRARCCFLRDPAHRRWRDWHLAIEACAWKPLVVELLVVLNLAFGP